MSYPVITQPQHAVLVNNPANVNVGPRVWSSELFACTEDMGSCVLGAICPIILAMQVATDADESCMVPCCVPGGMIAIRTKMRTQHNIQGSVCDDCVMIAFCGECTYCQMKREQDYLKQMGH